MKQQNNFLTAQQIKQYILKKSFACVELKEEGTLNNFIQLVETLDQQQIVCALKMVKNLLGGYGVFIMPFLRKFYESLNEQNIKQYLNQVRKLAFLIFDLCKQQEIPEFEIFNKFGKNALESKATLKQSQHTFIDQIKYISQHYGYKIINQEDERKYQSVISGFLKEYSESNKKFEEKALLKFQEICKKINKKDQTTISSTIMKLDDDSKSESEQSEENEDESFIENEILGKKQPKKDQISVYSVSGIDSSRDKTQNNFSLSDSSLQISKMDNTQKLQFKKQPSPIQEEEQDEWVATTSNQEQKPKINPLQISLPPKEKTKVKSLCCRKFLYEGQNITESDDTRITLVNYAYPFKNIEMTSLKNIFCSFLNSDGGILYIGIEKDKTGKRSVVGGQYSESKKELVLKTFRQIAQTIEPDIITHKMYNVSFVPLRTGYHPYSFIPGQFIIKCDIRYGIRDQLYSYCDGSVDRFVFRNQGELIMKEGRELLKNYRKRINNPEPIPEPLHEGPCQKPDIGEQTHDEGPVSYSKSFRPPPIQHWQEQPQFINPPTKFTKQPISRNLPPKDFKPILPRQVISYSQQSPKTKKQVQFSYFFVVGINESQLMPILEKQKLDHAVRIQSTKSRKLIVRGIDQSLCNKIHKLLKKLSEKYSSSISVYKMSLELKVRSTDEIYKILAKQFDKFQVRQKNILSYKFYKDSLQSFILLQQAKIPVQFWYG